MLDKCFDTVKYTYLGAFWQVLLTESVPNTTISDEPLAKCLSIVLYWGSNGCVSGEYQYQKMCTYSESWPLLKHDYTYYEVHISLQEGRKSLEAGLTNPLRDEFALLSITYRTPHWKGTQDEFWIPIKIPVEYGTHIDWCQDKQKIQKRKKSVGGPTLTNFRNTRSSLYKRQPIRGTFSD